MDKSVESVRSEPLTKERRFALQAKGMFVDASITNPASGMGQAARIAYRCKATGLTPELLGLALKSQPDILEDIARLGKERHSKTNADMGIISRQRLMLVVDAVFTIAEDLINLPDLQLKELYSASENKPTSSKVEKQLVDRATKLLATHGIDFVYPEPNLGDSAR